MENDYGNDANGYSYKVECQEEIENRERHSTRKESLEAKERKMLSMKKEYKNLKD